MGVTRIIARNVLWNWAGTILPMLAGFVVAPFLIHRLGTSTYGLWIVIGSLTGQFGLLDLGVRFSMGRNIAFFRAKNDRASINGLRSTAAAYLSAVAVFGLIITVALLPVFFLMFPDVPPDQVSEAQLALFLVGLNLSITLPLSIFDATLSAYQRFDLLNGVDIPVLAARVALTFTLIGNGQGLVTLALLTLMTTVVGAAAKAVLCIRMDPGLRLHWSLIGRAAAHDLFGYGIWYLLLSVARVITPQISPMVVGARLGVSWVTPFSIVSRLIGYASSIIIAGTQVLTPVATALHAEEKYKQQQGLIVEGSKYCMALALFFLTLFLFLGEPLLVLWIGPQMALAFPLLVVLAVGETLPMAQWITYSIILGMGRHRVLAYLSILENLVAIPLAIAMAEPFGLIGVCLAFTIPGALCRGVFQLIYACRVARLSLWRYVTRALLPPLVLACIPAAGLAILTGWHVPASWLELFAYGSAYTLCYGMFVLLLMKLGGLASRRPGNAAENGRAPPLEDVGSRPHGWQPDLLAKPVVAR
jgi:O-antigen/teichoic acid export membrane protein